MAATGKKTKRIKGKTLGINDFLGNAPIALNIQTKTYEDDDDYDMGPSSRPRAPVVLPSASRASRGGTYDDEKVPRHPPYMAYISNIPFEVEDSAIEDVFANLKVTNLRLPREVDGRLKGYGYVDFEDRESLVAAINLLDSTVCGRRIRIEVSNSDDRRMGRRSDRDRDREYDPERTSGDWRSGTRSEKEGGGGRDGGDRDWGSSFSRRDDRDGREGGREIREVDTTPGAWRDAGKRDDPPPERSYGGRDSYGDRSFSREGGGGFGDRDRDRGGGGFGDRGYGRDGDRGYSRDGDRGYGRDGERSYGGFGRDSDRDRGFSRDGDRGFGRDREGGDRGFSRDGDRGFSRDGDRDGGFRREGFGRSFGGGGFGDRDRERDRDMDRDAEVSGEPRTRKKLNLLPRTVPLNTAPEGDKPAKQDDETSQNDGEGRSDSSGDRNSSDKPTSPTPSEEKKAEERRPYKPPVPAASIFGGAKPVDTTAREREIEERLMKKAEELQLRDGHSRDRDEKRMWSRDRKVDDFDDKRPPRRTDDRRRDDRGRDEEDRGRSDYSRDERNSRMPYRGSGNSKEYRDSKDERNYRDSHDSKEPRNSSDSRDSKDGRNSRNSRNDREYSGNRDMKVNSEKEVKESRKDRHEDRPLPKTKDEPPNIITQNKFSYFGQIWSKNEGENDEDDSPEEA